MAKKHYLWLLKGIGIAIFLWIFSQIDFFEVTETIREADPLLLVVSLFVLLSICAVKSVRFAAITRSAGGEMSLMKAFRLFIIAIFLSTITPGRIGDLGRAVYLKNDGMNVKTAMSVALIDRVADLIVLTSLCVVSAWYLFGNFWGLIALLVLVVGIFAMRLSLSWTKMSDARKTWLQFLDVVSRPTMLFAVLSTTLLGWFLHFVWCVAIAESIGIDVPLLPFAASITLTSAVTMFPIAPTGLGTREAALLFFLGPFAVEAPKAVALGILMFASYIVCSLIGGFWWLRGVRSAA
jgi:hypothetical protein